MVLGPRHVCCASTIAALVCLLGKAAAVASTSSVSSASNPVPLARTFLPPSLGERSLQSCSTQWNSLTTCMSDSMTEAEVSACESCLTTYIEGDSQVSPSNCPAMNSFLCDALTECPCMSPCRVQYAPYIECSFKRAAAAGGMDDYTCDVNCDSNGSASGAADVSSLLVPALMGVLALASGLA